MLSNCPPKTINLSELCVLLKKEGRAAKTWLQNHNISLVREGRDKVASLWCVELALQCDEIVRLKRNHPVIWFELYEVYEARPDLKKAALIMHPPVSQIKKSISIKKLKTFIE